MVLLVSDGKSAGGPRIVRQPQPVLGGGANVPREKQESAEAFAKIARLEALVEKQKIDADNLKTYIAAIVIQRGGMAQLGPEELFRPYELFVSHDEKTNIVTFVAAVAESEPPL